MQTIYGVRNGLEIETTTSLEVAKQWATSRGEQVVELRVLLSEENEQDE